MADAESDLAALVLDERPISPRLRARKWIEPYLRGPITWSWLRRAHAAGPAALPVGLALWHYRTLKKALEFPVSLRDVCHLTGVSRCTARRGLLQLEAAALVSRTIAKGRKPLVTLRDVIPEVSPPAGAS